jgi:hypothetical protein
MFMKSAMRSKRAMSSWSNAPGRVELTASTPRISSHRYSGTQIDDAT